MKKVNDKTILLSRGRVPFHKWKKVKVPEKGRELEDGSVTRIPAGDVKGRTPFLPTKMINSRLDPSFLPH